MLEIGATSVNTIKILLRSKIAFFVSTASLSLFLFFNFDLANASPNHLLATNPVSVKSQNNNDFDNDGLTDLEEQKLGTERYLADTDGDGISDGIEVGNNPFRPLNHDNDQRIDALDSDDDNDGLPTVFEQQQDSDNDGIPDYLDTDSDNDGISDGEEAGMTLQDSDHDGIDNLVDVDNTGSEDKNGDGINDQFHFPDRNKNGKPDFLDKDIRYSKVKIPSDNILTQLEKNTNIPKTSNNKISPTKDQDHDGIPDAIEIKIGTNPKQRDSDNDLVPDAIEIGLILEYPQDTDHDGIIDALDDDDDNDGILTRNEDPNRDGSPANDDIDNDGVPNYQDANDDGDMTITRDESSTLDTDKDGVLDYLDKDDGVDRSLARLKKEKS